jgi:hypothetical protein
MDQIQHCPFPALLTDGFDWKAPIYLHNYPDLFQLENQLSNCTKEKGATNFLRRLFMSHSQRSTSLGLCTAD